MKLLISILVALTLAVVVALNAKVDSGYIMMAYGKWSVEMSGLLMALIVVAVFFILYISIRFLVGIKQIPGRTHNWRAHRKQVKGNDGLTRGLLLFTEGRWVEAEKLLLKQVKNSHAPLLNYLVAARAAHNMDKYQQRDDYLNIAYKEFPLDKVAIELTRSELLVQHGQYEQALASLRNLRNVVSNNHRMLGLLVKVYKQLEDWKNLKDLLQVIRKQVAMSDDELYPLITECHFELLKKAGEAEDVGVLLKAWSEIPKEYRSYKNILIAYCKLLMDKNSSELLEPLLKDAINKKWDSDLVYLYGKFAKSNATRQIVTAETWLSKHKKDPVLLFTLGRLCLRCELWGKAREYLSLSISNGGSAEVYYILAQLLERLDETDSAARYYQQGLSMLVDASPYELPNLVITEESNNSQRSATEDSNNSQRLKLISH
ncbi:MAG: hypothetical protein GXP19_10240 [Gammaproteobacteria bacterium]|nr:hypothetical protein [Gammaproteobacteria bacterium]